MNKKVGMTESSRTSADEANSRAERRKRDPIGQILDFLSNSESNIDKKSDQPVVTSAHAALPPVQSVLPPLDDRKSKSVCPTDSHANGRFVEHPPQIDCSFVSTPTKGPYLLDEGSAFKPVAKNEVKTLPGNFYSNIIPVDLQRDIAYINSYANANLLAAQSLQMSVPTGNFHGTSAFPVQCTGISNDIIAKVQMANYFQHPSHFDIARNMNMFSWYSKKIRSDSTFNPACILTTESSESHVTQTPPRYQCDSCKKSYSTYGGLSKHKQFHCINQVKKEFSCKFCGKCYGSLGALKMHIRTHTLPCKCKICGKAFSRPWLLQGHIRTHTGEKPFRCDHCSRAFADRSNLRAHLQTHSEIKKYGCKSCNKTFSRMSLLVKHKENHCYSR